MNANTADRELTITYTPASESQVIRYIDQKGKEISTQIVSGKYGLDTTSVSYTHLDVYKRQSVPKGTIGAKVDADGTYYYEVNAKVNIAQKVNFEFVDEYNDNNVVGETYSQEFVPGVETNLKFHMAMPDGYELGNGASIPSQYTLAAFSQTTPCLLYTSRCV